MTSIRFISHLANITELATKASEESGTGHRRMAQHYGILAHPCRPGAAAHKGKVEDGVHYVQRNFVAGQEFLDINEANANVKSWVLDEAGIRDHGTTHEMPLRRFWEDEQAALLPLHRQPFELMSVRRVTLHRDCHVQIDGSYYSAPFIYVGKKRNMSSAMKQPQFLISEQFECLAHGCRWVYPHGVG